MVDTVTRQQRSWNMSRVRGKNTEPELVVRRGLHSKGLRFRLHRKDLPGSPDIVLTRYRCVVFVHGCFWHGHDCPRRKLPSTRTEFWAAKIGANKARDARDVSRLVASGWRVIVVWECAINGPHRYPTDALLAEIQRCMESNAPTREIEGRPELRAAHRKESF
jgi:DNA mismatch endonuclease, patch repair protein